MRSRSFPGTSKQQLCVLLFRFGFVRAHCACCAMHSTSSSRLHYRNVVSSIWKTILSLSLHVDAVSISLLSLARRGVELLLRPPVLGNRRATCHLMQAHTRHTSIPPQTNSRVLLLVVHSHAQPHGIGVEQWSANAEPRPNCGPFTTFRWATQHLLLWAAWYLRAAVLCRLRAWKKHWKL